MKDVLLSDFEKFILPNKEKIVGGLRQWSCTEVYRNAQGTLTVNSWGDYDKGSYYEDICQD
jgi:hypothetical protein